MYRRFIQELAADVAVDFESEEVKEICDSVTDLSTRLFRIVEGRSPFFKSSRILLCGSMAEKTRIWRFTDNNKTLILEFDFLSVMELFKQDDFHTSKTCQGFMDIEQLKTIFPEKYQAYEDQFGSTGKLNARTISFLFKTEMMKAVDGLCKCLTCDIEATSEDCVRIGNIEETEEMSQSCCECRRHCNTGVLSIATGHKLHPIEMDATLVFKWKRNVVEGIKYPCEKSRQLPVIDDECIILVDFLPTVEVQKTADGSSDTKHVCYLVPKGCKYEHSTCWKISFCRLERHELISTSDTHRSAYMALKFILDYIGCQVKGIIETPKTYLLKTCVLLHIQECKHDTARMDVCILEIMEILSEAYKNGYLPSIFLGFNLLDKVQDSALPPEDEIWHRHRNEVMGKCWNFIKDTMESIEDIVPQCYDFDKIQTVLKLITLEYGRCWTRTDFRDVYLPDEPFFQDILRKFAHETYPSKAEMQNISKKTDRYLKERFTGPNLPFHYMCMLRCDRYWKVLREKNAEFCLGMTEEEVCKYLQESEKFFQRIKSKTDQAGCKAGSSTDSSEEAGRGNRV